MHNERKGSLNLPPENQMLSPRLHALRLASKDAGFNTPKFIGGLQKREVVSTSHLEIRQPGILSSPMLSLKNIERSALERWSLPSGPSLQATVIFSNPSKIQPSTRCDDADVGWEENPESSMNSSSDFNDADQSVDLMLISATELDSASPLHKRRELIHAASDITFSGPRKVSEDELPLLAIDESYLSRGALDCKIYMGVTPFSPS